VKTLERREQIIHLVLDGQFGEHADGTRVPQALLQRREIQ
jgi:hypothetical protein